jgi:diguanylate cyclase (GGDEF)-like protein
MFYRELERALARAEREPCRIAVILIDLDRFKEVNDTFGHASGDRLLVEVGKRLAECVRTEDLVARLGGDEFAVIAVSRQAPDGFAALARRIVDRLGERLRIGGIEIEPGASLGMTVFPDDRGSLNELMVHADRALYAAKQTGRGTWMLFDDAIAKAGRTARAKVALSAAPWSAAISASNTGRASASAPLEVVGPEWARTKKE